MDTDIDIDIATDMRLEKAISVALDKDKAIVHM